MTREDIYKQNITDLLRVVQVLGQILEEKELNGGELQRISYCIKNIKTVTEKQIFLNVS